VGVGGNRKSGSSTLDAYNTIFATGPSQNDTIHQQSGSQTNGSTASVNVMLTEPIASAALLELHYNPSYTKSTSDTRTFALDEATNQYALLNDQLSSTYENTYFTNGYGAGLRLRWGSMNISSGVTVQTADLRGDQTFPQPAGIRKTFTTLLPNLSVMSQLEGRQGIRFVYRASTSSPSISQLQNIVDNSNPLLLSAGNPDLNQSTTHTVTARLGLASAENARSALLFLFGSVTKDYIGNSVVTATRDTVLPGNVKLAQGTQLTIPVNLRGNASLRLFSTFGLPVDLLGSNLNLNLGATWNRVPGLINGVRNISNSTALSPGLVLGSNISEGVDFTVSYTATFNSTKNSVQQNLDNSYFSHTAGTRLSLLLPGGIDIKTDVTNLLTSGASSTQDQNYVLWNFGVGKKFFSNNQGEILLSVYDLLNQNRNVTRTVTETYIEDATTRALTRYVMLTFSYNLRQFKETRREF
jgi:hypothetical protein